MAKNLKPTIIILHGWGLTGDRFSPLTDALQKRGYEVEAPDLPGFGNALLPDKPWGLKEYAGFLNAWIRQRKIDKPVLFGHSFGGRVALKFEEVYQGQIQALILSGAPGYTPASRFRLVVGLVLTKAGGALFSLPPFSLLEEQARLLWYRLIGAKDYLRPQQVMRDTFKKIVTEGLVGSMQAVRCPCMLVWGEDDRIVPVGIARRMEKIIPGAKLIVIPDSRHGVPFRKPNEVATIIDTFLNEGTH